jgi:Mycothiol maleylpyruvate isomerase N-terminal domain
VKDLLGHMYRDVDRLGTALEAPRDLPVEHDGISYWTTYDPVADGPDIADRAKEIADGYETGAELARAFDEMWPERVAAAGGADGARSVQTFGPVLRLDEFLKTRVLELEVHRLDLLEALHWERDVDPPAAEAVLAVLNGLLGAERPPAVGWTDVEYIEAGTGRRQISAEERAILGELAGRFPLLG